MASRRWFVAYEQTIGRDPTATELALNQQQIANGTSVATLRAYLATTGYAAAALAKLYTDVVGRAITPGELNSGQAALGAGTATLAGLRNDLATTDEALTKLQPLYMTESNRALTPGEAAADERLIAGRSSLAAIRTYLSTSAEAVRGLTERFQTALGTAPAPSEHGSSGHHQARHRGSPGRAVSRL